MAGNKSPLFLCYFFGSLSAVFNIDFLLSLDRERKVETMYQNYMFNNPYQFNQNKGIQYVNGIESARAYNLAPNDSVLLMDSGKAMFYIKQADASGFSTVKAYDFVEHKEVKPETEFVSRAEFNEIKAQLYNLSNELKNTVKTPILSAERVNNESNIISKEYAEHSRDIEHY